jgi:hypothetical protein
MDFNIFGFEKDDRVDEDWHKLVNKLEEAGWERESFTTLYEAGNLFIPDAPEAEMSYESRDLLFNVTAFLTEKKLYLSIAPDSESGHDGQVSLITRYDDDLDLWLDTVAVLPQELRLGNFGDLLMELVHLFPKTCLEMPVDEERVCVPGSDPIAVKVLKTPWCRKGPCLETILDETERDRLRQMAKQTLPWM